jgi:DNA-binding protein H-NS
MSQSRRNYEDSYRHKGLRKQLMDIIREKGITAEQLGFAPAGKGSRKTAPPKYRDPVSGATWAGRGRTPKWINGSREEYAL